MDNRTALGNIRRYDINALFILRPPGHEKNVNILTKKSCLSVLLSCFKRLFRLRKFLTLRLDAF